MTTSLNPWRCWPENAACLQLPQAYFRHLGDVGRKLQPACSFHKHNYDKIRGRRHIFRLVCSLTCMPHVAVPRRLSENQSKRVGTLCLASYAVMLIPQRMPIGICLLRSFTSDVGLLSEAHAHKQTTNTKTYIYIYTHIYLYTPPFIFVDILH